MRAKIVVEHSRDRLADVVRVEITGTGRQPVYLQKIELGHRYDTGRRNGQTPVFATRWDFELQPADGRDLNDPLDPTDSTWAEMKMSDLLQKWTPGDTVLSAE